MRVPCTRRGGSSAQPRAARPLRSWPAERKGKQHVFEVASHVSAAGLRRCDSPYPSLPLLLPSLHSPKYRRLLRRAVHPPRRAGSHSVPRGHAARQPCVRAARALLHAPLPATLPQLPRPLPRRRPHGVRCPRCPRSRRVLRYRRSGRHRRRARLRHAMPRRPTDSADVRAFSVSVNGNMQ